MFTLHHLNKSRSTRILWLFEELGMKYEIKRYDRDPVTLLAPPELKKIHPLGKAPVITDGKVAVAESAVILDYILDSEGGGRLRPAVGTSERLKYNYFMHYAEGSLTPPLLVKLILDKLSAAPVPLPVRPIGAVISKGVHKAFLTNQLRTHFDFVEGELGKTKWFAGSEFTAADIQMSYPIEAAESRGVLNNHPNLQAYLSAIRNRPAYKRAIEIGGPVMI